MSDRATEEETKTAVADGAHSADLILEYELEAPPEKVWRAITIEAFREEWLPGTDLAQSEPLTEVPREEVSYHMRDDTLPFLESIVTFELIPQKNCGTLLRIAHRLVDIRSVSPIAEAANSNELSLMLAA